MPKVKLSADCYVGAKTRKKDEIVEVQDEIAADFGEVLTLETLSKMRKDAIVSLAYSLGIETVPDSSTIPQIAQMILDFDLK